MDGAFELCVTSCFDGGNEETSMTAEITDLKTHRARKIFQNFANETNSVFASEAEFFQTGKFFAFAQGYVDSGFKPDHRPTFHVTVQFRDYAADEQAKALLARLKSDGFKIEKQAFSNEFVKRIKSGEVKPDHANAYGPWATREVEFDQALRILANREDGSMGAYQPSRYGFRVASDYAYDANGVGFNVVCCGYDARRGRFEEHVVDDQYDVEELCAMMSEIRAALGDDDDDVVAFRPRL
jgi:hypothetical protein